MDTLAEQLEDIMCEFLGDIVWASIFVSGKEKQLTLKKGYDAGDYCDFLEGLKVITDENPCRGIIYIQGGSWLNIDWFDEYWQIHRKPTIPKVCK